MLYGFLQTDASAALSETLPFSLAQLALCSTLLSYSVNGKDERKIFLMISIYVRTQQTKNKKESSSQIFPIIKIFLLEGDFVNFRTWKREPNRKIWFRGGNPINWLDPNTENHTLDSSRRENINFNLFLRLYFVRLKLFAITRNFFPFAPRDKLFRLSFSFRSAFYKHPLKWWKFFRSVLPTTKDSSFRKEIWNIKEENSSF